MSTITETEVPETVLRWRAFEEASGKRARRNSFDRVLLYEQEIDKLCRKNVPDAAALLDEHVPGWHERITEPLVMGSTVFCVLGQVFDAKHYEDRPRRRFFGLLPPRKRKPSPYAIPGYCAGLAFFERKGVHVHPFVFSSNQAAPFWGAEISRRST